MRRVLLALFILMLLGLNVSTSHAAVSFDMSKLSKVEKEALRKGTSDRTGRKMQLFGDNWLLIDNNSASGGNNELFLMNFSELGNAYMCFTCRDNKLQLGFSGEFVRSGNFIDSRKRRLLGINSAEFLFIDYSDEYIEERIKKIPSLTRSQFTEDKKSRVEEYRFIILDDTFIIDASTIDTSIIDTSVDNYIESFIWNIQKYKTLVIGMNTRDEQVFNIEDGDAFYKALEPLQKACRTNYRSVYDLK